MCLVLYGEVVLVSTSFAVFKDFFTKAEISNSMLMRTIENYFLEVLRKKDS